MPQYLDRHLFRRVRHRQGQTDRPDRCRARRPAPRRTASITRWCSRGSRRTPTTKGCNPSHWPPAMHSMRGRRLRRPAGRHAAHREQHGRRRADQPHGGRLQDGTEYGDHDLPEQQLRGDGHNGDHDAPGRCHQPRDCLRPARQAHATDSPAISQSQIRLPGRPPTAGELQHLQERGQSQIRHDDHD